MTKKQVLGIEAVSQKLLRLAHQLKEAHFSTSKLCLLGIETRGWVLAQRLGEILTTLSPRCSVRVAPWGVARVDGGRKQLDRQVPATADEAVVLVDDVLNTGGTLLQAVAVLADLQVQSIEIAVLVARSHKRYPIEARYIGHRLNTTLADYVEVDVERGVFLS